MAAKKSKQVFATPGQAWADALFNQAREEARKEAIKMVVELYRQYPRVVKGFDDPQLDIHLSEEDLKWLSKEE